MFTSKNARNESVTMRLLACLLFTLWVAVTKSCLELEVVSDTLGTVYFKQVTSVPRPANANETYQSTGRPVFMAVREDGDTTSPNIYLYHTISDEVTGVGRWVINEDFGSSEAAMAYIDSWSILPALTDETADSEDGSSWMIPDVSEAIEGRNWVYDKSLELYCTDEDDTVYFETSSVLQPSLAGFYVRTLQMPPSSKYTGPLYTQIKMNSLDKQMYMFRLGSGVWMIGEEAGVDAGLAYAEDAAEIATGLKSKEWKFITTGTAGEPEWIVDEAAFVVGATLEYPDDAEDAPEGSMKEQTFSNVYESLRFVRSLKYVPIGQQYYTLRNSLPMPQIGLGTGGLALEETKNIVKLALKLGYRSLDLAREYKNEHLVGELFAESLEDESMPLRAEVFVESKVWPTELGFFPTSEAILASLEELKTNYVDLYLLHWPECNKEIDWMRCDDVKDPDAVWTESWRALEKAYAEGRVMSIGVSNFNATLLNEAVSFASIRPHVVQNWAEVGHVDEEVRAWCFKNDAVYQPYASIRNLQHMDQQTQSKLAAVATSKKVSSHAASLRFFLQTGAALIPRSSSEEHLRDNINVFNIDELNQEEMTSLGWNVNLDELEHEHEHEHEHDEGIDGEEGGHDGGEEGGMMGGEEEDAEDAEDEEGEEL